MKKILFIGSDLSPPFATMEAKMVVQLRGSLKESVTSFILSINVTPKDDQRDSTISINGIQKGPLILRKLIYGIQLMSSFLWSISNNKYDVIHFIWVGFDPLTQFMVKAAKAKGIKVVVTILNRYEPMARYQNADYFIVHSKSTQQLLKNQYSYFEHSKVIYPPVDQKDYIKSKQAYFVFASAPRTKEQIESRGVYLLLDAMKILQDKNYPLSLEFVGRWPEGASILESIVTSKLLNNVNMTHSFREDIDELIGQSRGLVIPYVGSTTGDVPLSAIESLAYGTPVITTHEFKFSDKGDFPAIRICGQTATELADALISAYEHGNIEEHCREVVKECSTESFVDSYEQIYKRLINEG